MKSEMRYVPIDCSLHDRLEAAATLGRECTIRFRNPDGTAREILDRIVDVFASGGEEFIRTSSGLRVRLDRLDRVGGVSFGGGQ